MLITVLEVAFLVQPSGVHQSEQVVGWQQVVKSVLQSHFNQEVFLNLICF